MEPLPVCFSLLQVPNNQLATLPANLHQLSKLTALDLEGNQLASLPDEVFSGLRSLTDINLGK
jgi:Leucine-rich repeat (LRR) protein